MRSDVFGRGAWTQGEIMQYAKMDLAKFTEQLNVGRYESRTGARRAIGKMSEWSAKDSAAAHVLVNKRFGEGDALAPKSTKKGKAKTAKPAKRPAKVVAKHAKVTPATLNPPPKKPAKPAKRAPRVALPASIPVAQSNGVGHYQTSEANFRRAPVTVEPLSSSRVTAASGVIQALKNSSPITAAEQAALDVALREYRAYESDQSKALIEPVATPVAPRAPAPKAPPRGRSNGVATKEAHTAAAAPPPPAVTNERPRIAVPAAAPVPPSAAVSGITPMTDEEYEAAKSKLSPEEQASLGRLQKHVAIDVGPTPPPIT
jgi:hypothetical protein